MFFVLVTVVSDLVKLEKFFHLEFFVISFIFLLISKSSSFIEKSSVLVKV